MEKARRKLLPFTRYTMPRYEANWHHVLVADRLDAVIRGECERLMVFMPPRHGKSELVSRRAPAFALGRNQDEQIIGCSYSHDLATSNNREIQRIMMDDSYKELFKDAIMNERNVVADSQGAWLRNARIFELVQSRGYYLCSGVGGPITGRGMTLGIIDDPVKNRAEADSETFREKVWEWYTSTFLTRAEKGCRLICTFTRWHEDDLAGRILARARETGEEWEILNLPAILDTAPEEYDVREEGEPLWPAKYSSQKLSLMKQAIGSRDWEALYQQRPAPAGGGIFKRDWWQYWDNLPTRFDQVFQSWDMTFKEAGSSFVVGQVWGKVGSRFYLLDQVRGRWDFMETLRQFHAMCERHPMSRAKLVEDKANGPAVISALGERVPGIIPITPQGSKEARAHAVTPYCEAGNVFLPRRASWVGDFVEETASFPNGAFDDQVDAMTQAISYGAEDPIAALAALSEW